MAQPSAAAGPKTANPEHMRSNATVDFAISTEDMGTLPDLRVDDYSECRAFPVYGS